MAEPTFVAGPAFSSIADVEKTYGAPQKLEKNKFWYVMYYDGIHFTFKNGEPPALDPGREVRPRARSTRGRRAG